MTVMARRYETWIGGRYVRSRSANSFVSLISAISMLGIAIAVAVLIIVLSVVNGFERELKDRLLAMTGIRGLRHRHRMSAARRSRFSASGSAVRKSAGSTRRRKMPFPASLD